MGLPHPAVTLEAGRGRTQVAGPGGVRVSEGAAELLGRQRCRRDGDQARLLKPRRAMIEHRHDGGPGARGLGKPHEPSNLVGDPPAATIRFPDGVHRVWPPVHVEAAALPLFVAHQRETAQRYQGSFGAEATPPTRSVVAGRPANSAG